MTRKSKMIPKQQGGNREEKFTLVVAVGLGIISLLNLYEYFSKPPRTYEIDLLKSASAILLQHEVQDQEDALRYARSTLEIVAKSENVNIPEISMLEAELSRINEEPQSDYGQALRSIGMKIEKTANKHGRDSLSLLVGFFGGMYSTLKLTQTITSIQARKYGIKL